MSELVRTDYNGIVVSFTEDAWFNATEVAERFGKRANDFLSLPATKEYIAALDSDAVLNTRKSGISIAVEPRSWVKAKRGKNGGTWLHPDLAVQFARWIDVRFAIWCDRQIRGILTGAHPHYDWKRMRHEATASYKVMGQILQMTRQRLGKTCAPHHYSNEARLINWALTGAFGKVDRDALSVGDLDLLAKLETLDSVLIGCGQSYEDRKGELERFAADQRTAHVPSLEARANG